MLKVAHYIGNDSYFFNILSPFQVSAHLKPLICVRIGQNNECPVWYFSLLCGFHQRRRSVLLQNNDNQPNARPQVWVRDLSAPLTTSLNRGDYSGPRCTFCSNGFYEDISGNAKLQQEGNDIWIWIFVFKDQSCCKTMTTISVLDPKFGFVTCRLHWHLL